MTAAGPRQHSHIVTYHGGRLLSYYCSRTHRSLKAVHLLACWKSVRHIGTVCATPSSAPGRWSTCNFSSGDSASPPSRSRDDCPCRSPNLKRQAATRREELTWGNASTRSRYQPPRHFKHSQTVQMRESGGGGGGGNPSESEKRDLAYIPLTENRHLGELEKKEEKKNKLTWTLLSAMVFVQSVPLAWLGHGSSDRVFFFPLIDQKTESLSFRRLHYMI